MRGNLWPENRGQRTCCGWPEVNGRSKEKKLVRMLQVWPDEMFEQPEERERNIRCRRDYLQNPILSSADEWVAPIVRKGKVREAVEGGILGRELRVSDMEGPRVWVEDGEGGRRPNLVVWNEIL